MAVTPTSLRAYFPEFQTLGDTFMQPYLDNALQRTPAAVWGGLQDQGVTYLAAHLMAISPYGVHAKLSSKDGSSVYGKQRKQLNRTVTAGLRVAGMHPNDTAGIG